MAPNRADGDARERTYIDTPVVIAIDHHDVAIGLKPLSRPKLLVEALESNPVVHLDRGHDIRPDLAHDPGRHLGGDLVHMLCLQLEPPHPVRSACSDDFNGSVVGPLEKLASVLPQPNKLTRVVVLEDSQILQT